MDADEHTFISSLVTYFTRPDLMSPDPPATVPGRGALSHLRPDRPPAGPRYYRGSTTLTIVTVVSGPIWTDFANFLGATFLFLNCLLLLLGTPRAQKKPFAPHVIQP